MNKTTGSNTSAPPTAQKGAIDISATVTHPGASGHSTSPKVTASAKKNIEPTVKPLAELENEYQPPIFEQPLPIDSLSVANLPPNILETLRPCLRSCHFVAVAPNTTGALVTRDTIADLPPGFIIVLVHNPIDFAFLPPTHQEGKVYVIA